MAGLENDIDEIEAQLFSGDPAVTKRIYDLSGEVMEIQRAVRPLQGMISSLRAAMAVFALILYFVFRSTRWL